MLWTSIMSSYMILQGWYSWKTPHCVASVWMRLMPVLQPPELPLLDDHLRSMTIWMSVQKAQVNQRGNPTSKAARRAYQGKGIKANCFGQASKYIGNSDQIFHFCGSQDLPLAEVIYKSRKHFQELSCESLRLSLQTLHWFGDLQALKKHTRKTLHRMTY